MDLAHEQEFYQLLNSDGSLIDMLSVYVSELKANPGREAEVPTERFTATPNSTISRDIQAAISNVRSEHPDAVDIMFAVACVSTDLPSDSPCPTGEYSSIVQDPAKYPGVSGLTIAYTVQTSDGMSPQQSTRLSLSDNYTVIQRPTGEIIIND